MLDRSLEFHFLGRVDVAEGGELGPLRRRLVVGIRVGVGVGGRRDGAVGDALVIGVAARVAVAVRIVRTVRIADEDVFALAADAGPEEAAIRAPAVVDHDVTTAVAVIKVISIVVVTIVVVIVDTVYSLGTEVVYRS